MKAGVSYADVTLTGDFFSSVESVVLEGEELLGMAMRDIIYLLIAFQRAAGDLLGKGTGKSVEMVFGSRGRKFC